jgi:ABC-type nitrate/sulfonate/bicarbonate transport system permease component
MTGLSVSSALSLIAIIGSEIIVGIAGVGSEINLARFSGATVTAYAFTVWTGVLGLTISWLVNRLKSRLLPWQTVSEVRP